ncbi:hypothetical protein DMI97_23045 [Salmonella enterica]|nr:hypothetical protein [Salmonella enterica]
METKNDIKKTLNSLDSDLINELLDVVQLALNDIDTLEILSKENGASVGRLAALAELSIELANGGQPTIKNLNDLFSRSKEISLMMGKESEL